MSEEVPVNNTILPFPFACQLAAWFVAVGSKVRKGSLLCSCVQSVGVGMGDGGEGERKEETTLQIKSGVVGVVQELMYTPGDIVQPGSVMVKVEEKCQHDIVVFDMCADCGLNLRKQPTASGLAPQSVAANIMVIHDNAGIRISQQEAEVLAHKDKLRLLKTRKLTLVVDLDQTLIHTATDPHIEPGLPDVYGFRLSGQPIVYHCRLRPHVRQFLEKVSKLYELHVFTMATKDYAAAVIDILDPEKHLFCDRIITRDEFFDPRSKALRFKSVFPCGDSMVAIIDDREDVWGRCPNLVHVKPYVFFSGTSDINAPPPLVPTFATPSSSHSSSLPSTPTTPRPFFGGVNQGSGVVPHGQPRPFKMRHISRRPQHSQKPTAQPQSDLAFHAHSAKSRDNGTPPVQQQQKLQPSPVENRPNLDENSSDLRTRETSNGSEGGTNEHQSTIHELHHEQFVSDPTNVNSNNNNNSKRRAGDVDTEPGDSASEEEGDGEETESGDGEGGGGGGETSSQGGGEGEKASAGKVVGGDKKGDGESSSSGSGSSSDSEDSSSSGSSSAMDDSLPQEVKLTQEKVGVEMGEADMDVNVPAEDIQDSDASQAQSEGAATATEQKEKKSTVEIEDTDSFLTYLGDVLERIHSTFYTEFSKMMDGCDISTMSDIPTPDLKSIIPEMRHSLLKGAKILFTGVIPTNIPPQRSPIWNTARAFGAIVHDKLVPGLGSTNPRATMKATTHVIAGKSGTAKLKEAKRVTGMKIVNPRWLWSCAEQWRWLDEKQFPVEADEVCTKEEAKDREVGDSKTKREKPTSDSTAKKKRSKSSPSEQHTENMSTASDDKPGHSSRLDSRISVSDEELERMEAEVDAEMGSSSSSSGEEEPLQEESLRDDPLQEKCVLEESLREEPLQEKCVQEESMREESLQEERLGSRGSVERSSDDILNYERFLGVDSGGSARWESRKRKHVEVDDSSRSNSPQSNSEPRIHSDSSDDDVLAALLEEDSSPL